MTVGDPKGMRPGNFTVTPRWLGDHVLYVLLRSRLGLNTKENGGRLIVITTCRKEAVGSPLLPPQPTTRSPVLPCFPIHVEESIPSSLQYLSHVSLHHFPIHIQHLFLRDKLYHTSSYIHITYTISISLYHTSKLHHLTIASPLFPKCPTVFVGPFHSHHPQTIPRDPQRPRP